VQRIQTNSLSGLAARLVTEEIGSCVVCYQYEGF